MEFRESVESYLVNIVLLVLVLVLGVLLYMRQRQLQKVQPLDNLEKVLQNIRDNLLSSRTEGKIQKVASHLSDILINYLQCDRILFFRKQRRYMEMNYVYGLKKIQRSKYRVRVTNGLVGKCLEKNILHPISDFEDYLNPDLVDLLRRENFNLVFPIFWSDSLFGVYFIGTRLPLDHPLIRSFLMFLNQNLSAAYHITRLESSRQILEKEVEKSRLTLKRMEENLEETSRREPVLDPGHLIEMFSHRNVDELMASLFEKVKAGLRAEKLLFYSPPAPDSDIRLKYSMGLEAGEFQLDSREFQEISGKLNKRQVYDLSKIGTVKGGEQLSELVNKEKMEYLATFSLSDSERGLLIWSGRKKKEKPENRLLERLEGIARKALINAREFERVEEKSYTDSLTGLYNHRYFIKRLNEEIQRAIRYRRKVGLLLFDIDDFKLYNDNYGHQWGDELLRRMGRTLARSLRSIDIVARYGGDEFGIIMPEADKSTCGIFMDRLRHAIAVTDFRDRLNGFEGRITISIGSSIFPDDTDNAEKLINFADKALFKSKEMGRNRSTVFDPGLLEK